MLWLPPSWQHMPQQPPVCEPLQHRGLAAADRLGFVAPTAVQQQPSQLPRASAAQPGTALPPLRPVACGAPLRAPLVAPIAALPVRSAGAASATERLRMRVSDALLAETRCYSRGRHEYKYEVGQHIRVSSAVRAESTGNGVSQRTGNTSGVKRKRKRGIIMILPVPATASAVVVAAVRLPPGGQKGGRQSSTAQRQRRRGCLSPA